MKIITWFIFTEELPQIIGAMANLTWFYMFWGFPNPVMTVLSVMH